MTRKAYKAEDIPPEWIKALESCSTCEGHGRLIRTIGNSTVCPYDDTVPCPDCGEERE